MFKAGFPVTTPIGIGTIVAVKGQSGVTAAVNGAMWTGKSSECRAVPTIDGMWVVPALGSIAVGDDIRFLNGTVHTVGKSQKSWVQCACHSAWRQTYSVLVRSAMARAIGPVSPSSYDACAPVVVDAAWTKHWAAWTAGFATTHTKAIQNYTSSWYVQVNKSLRAGHPATAIKYIDRLDDALGMGRTDRDMIVWRSGSSKFDKATPVGAEFTDAGFGSSTIDKSVAFNWGSHNKVLFEIRVLAGSVGGYVDNVSSCKGEAEFIIPRNARYRVAGRREESHRVVFVVDLLQD